jgi:hypothetical protein
MFIFERAPRIRASLKVRRGKEVFAVTSLKQPRGRPVGGGGIHPNYAKTLF